MPTVARPETTGQRSIGLHHGVEQEGVGAIETGQSQAVRLERAREESVVAGGGHDGRDDVVALAAFENTHG